MFILCNDINKTNFDETLLLATLSKFKLTSLSAGCKGTDEDILITLLKTPSIQETLEHFNIYKLDIFEYISVIELLVEFKRIKTIEILFWEYSEDDKLGELKLKIEQFEKKLRKKHSEIDIDIIYEHRMDGL